ncbi:outer membrane protein [Sphingomonas sp. ASY06-1R]|uniref:outer membrane protein n=1 Tax=Sphingomonas sp. ASY06-1R TaxID=3445771 RepID=UPI003FA21D39
MRKTFLTAVAAACLVGSAAAAQDTTSTSSNGTSFRGFRAEIQAGGDRFQSQGTHDHNVAFGGAIGYDGLIGDRIVVGPEFTYWRGRGENNTPGVNGGTVSHKSFNELGAGIRAGYLFNPKLLGYVTGGWVTDEQRKAFTGTATETGFYDHFNTDGYQVGAGVEYSLTDRFYTGVGYKYSNYQDHTARQRLFLSAGVRF